MKTSALPPDFSRVEFSSHKDDAKRLVTDRQREVWVLMAEGCTGREISERLGMSIKTYETHRAHLLDRTGARNVADLTRGAIALGLIKVKVRK